LFVVPCVYSLLSKLESKKAHHLLISETGEVVKTPVTDEKPSFKEKRPMRKKA